MKMWVDPQEMSPSGYLRANSVSQAKLLIIAALINGEIEEINICQDLNSYGQNNLNAFDLLEWMIESNIQVNVKFHGNDSTQNGDLQKFIDGSCLCLS